MISRIENESFAGGAFMRHPIFIPLQVNRDRSFFTLSFLTLAFFCHKLIKKEITMANFVNDNRRSDFDDDFNGHEPNEVTRNALLEADRLTNDPHTRYFSNVEEALEELKKD